MSDFAQPQTIANQIGAISSLQVADLDNLESPPAAIVPTGPKPSLTTAQIWKFSKQFRDNSMPYYYLWRMCNDAVTNWRAYTVPDTAARFGMEVQYFNRARDVSFNRTTPMYRTISANLGLAMPVWNSRPASESPQAIASAEADKIALRYIWEDSELTDVYQKMMDYGIIGGTSATLTYMADGKICEEAFGPDRIRAEPGIDDPDKSRFLAVTRITTRDKLKESYPDKAAAIDAAPRPQRLSPTSDGWAQLPEDRVEVLEAYCVSGHCYLLIGDGPNDVLWEGMTPQKCMPIEIHRYTRIPDYFWGLGAIETMLPEQYGFSQSLNQILRNARLTNNPKLLYHRLAEIEPDAFTSQAGEKIPWSGSTPPSFMGLQPMSQYAIEMPSVMQAGIGASTGFHAVSTGAREVGVVTGAAVNAMTANDKMAMQVTIRDVKKLVRRKARVHLIFMQEYYSEDQFIAMFDRYGTGEFAMIHAQDLSKNPNVFFESDSLFAYDVEARQSRIMALVQQGALTPDVAFKALRDNTDPFSNAKSVQDYKEASDALKRVAQMGFEVKDLNAPPVPDPMTGQMVPPTRKVVRLFPTDNFEAFAAVAKSFMRSPAFDALPMQRQDDIEKYYLDLLDKLSPAPMQPPAGGASVKPSPQLPAPPKPAQPAPSGPSNKPAPTLTHEAIIAPDKAEAS